MTDLNTSTEATITDETAITILTFTWMQQNF